MHLQHEKKMTLSPHFNIGTKPQWSVCYEMILFSIKYSFKLFSWCQYISFKTFHTCVCWCVCSCSTQKCSLHDSLIDPRTWAKNHRGGESSFPRSEWEVQSGKKYLMTTLILKSSERRVQWESLLLNPPREVMLSTVVQGRNPCDTYFSFLLVLGMLVKIAFRSLLQAGGISRMQRPRQTEEPLWSLVTVSAEGCLEKEFTHHA